MIDAGLYLSIVAVAIWLIVLLLPWRPWSVREALEADSSDYEQTDLSDITVVIPARNEEEFIGKTLEALSHQGRGLNVIVVDDESTDGTLAIIRQSNLQALKVVRSGSLPAGWTGKLWAQEQGLKQVGTPYTLLLDADIVLRPGMIKSLKNKQAAESVSFVSLMAVLRFESFWEKLLMPAFVFFFKMIYPFALANRPDSKMATAAGGCIFVETDVLRRIGGMASIKDALIDDCTLAKTVKSAGYKIWMGLTHGVLSQRPYRSLRDIWDMVARTAYTQLYYSVTLLLICTMSMLAMYWLPAFGLFYFQGGSVLLSFLAILLMVLIYSPVLRFYAFNPAWGFILPLIASLYLLMTWTSAIRYWKGERSRWKGRVYQKI
ncbi:MULTISPECIES: glycosyltransferase [Methylobacter]|jgi:hopene-associated glycosyltransferase HpnB|uniref:glycosyltransferase n=1 Tax=Methylobacter TaxID=429 RepID=UPI000373A051|nr:MULTISPECIES: glycosyltransferase [Methylobacter]